MEKEVLILHLYEALSIFRGRVHRVLRALIDLFDSVVGGKDFCECFRKFLVTKF